MMRRVLRAFLPATVLAMALGATASRAEASTQVYVRIGPPARVVEVRPARPGAHYVWRDGYHRWDGHHYVWTHGYWAVPPRAHAHWVPAHWAHNGHGYYLVRGHWRY